VVGLELKHEFVAGSLRSPREAGVPMIAAVGGMAVPAVIYAVLVIGLGDSSALRGWATSSRSSSSPSSTRAS
jgi:NhaA family Na+:H+ antiporter